MKKPKMIIAALGFLAAVALVSCENKERKLENAQENFEEAKDDLREAQREFREETQKELMENETTIVTYRAKVNEQDEKVRADYQARVDDLERRNKELKARLDAYNDDNRDSWENFKREFRHDMDELGNAFRDLGRDNKK